MKRLSGKKDKYQKYAPLLKAALKGDWETAKKFFDQDPDAITAPITRELETALYMATGSGPAAINFVAELLKLMPAEALAQRDIAGHNPLHLGACVGNKAAAVLLLEKNPGLLSMREGRGWLPVHFAAIHAKKKTLSYLLKVTFEDDAAMRTLFVSPDGSTEPSGTDLLIDVITSGFYDLALDLVHRHPQLATSLTPKDNDSGLGAIARKLENSAEDPSGVEIENPVSNSQLPVQQYHWACFIGKAFPLPAVIQKSQAVLWKVFALLVPQVKRIREQKQMHQHALQLVRYLVKEIVILNDLSMYDLLETKLVVNAARLGIHEVVEEIVESIPKLAWARDSECRSIYQRAVIERHENIFNLIYQMSDHKHTVSMSIDESGNNILHIAGQLAPLYKLNLVSGAALQMQRELQWFKADYGDSRRNEKKRPSGGNHSPNHQRTRVSTVLGHRSGTEGDPLRDEVAGAEALAHRDEAGNTPLHLSALVDNTAAAKLLVGKNRELLCMREGRGWLPVHYAAVNKKKLGTLMYLLKASGEDDAAKSMLFFSSEYDKPSGTELLIDVITSGYYDIALDLVHWYPQLALSQTPENYDCGLGAIARQAKAFPSGTDLNFWERIVYDHVPVMFKDYAEDSKSDEDVPVKFENYAEDSSRAEFGINNPVNNSELPAHEYYWARSIFDAMVSATRLGIHEVVEEIVEAVPKLAWVRDSEGYSLFQQAVIERHENIFNLIYQMSAHKNCQTLLMDKSGNTILHLAGKLAPPEKLQSVNGAVLQMQREFQWYKKSPTTRESSEHWPSDFGRRSVFAINHFTGTKIWPTLHNHLPLEEAGYSSDESSVYSLEIQEDSEEEDDDLSESEVNDWFRPIPENPTMPLQIQNWPGREGAIQLCSFEAVENKAFICDECGIHEDGSVPTIWCEFPRGHKDNLSYHKECFITILRKATKDKNVARWVGDEFLATKLKNIKASKKEDTKKLYSPFVTLMFVACQLNMSDTEKKRLTCICYWNGRRTVLPNGTFEYYRGVCEAVLIEDGMSYNEMLSKICSCLKIRTYDKVLFYNSKRDKTKYLRVKDDNGVEMLFHMNEEEVDVFVEVEEDD
ncbi:hypothetical protein RHGRI_012922 [Rhododendron griersonianum]|uniref:Uncharacterized protein n=1 Tax=Rhododendron griersonianum TaxID=479676 RepID=A0AAV6K3L9_9ERIC|nr:hypothetical protein RHGRI_012922 [Rhododendron griersonianum]